MVQTVEQFAVKEIDLYGRWRSKAAELAEAERAAGEVYRDDGIAGVDSVVRLRVELAVIDQAIGTVRRGRSAAIVTKFRTQAEGARVTAGVKRAELDSLLKKRAQFVSQLAELEGVRGGRFEASGAELKSSVLLREIGGLDHLARSLDAAQIPDHGLFDSGGGGVVTDLAVLLAVLSHESAAPTCAALRAWLASVEADAAVRNKCEGFEHQSRRVRIAWRDGQIDYQSSYIFVANLARLQDSRSEERGVDVGTGTFRALPPQVASRAAAQLS